MINGVDTNRSRVDRNSSYDVVVVGAGPAGIAAASVAGEHGKRVVLVDSNPWSGGQIWRSDVAKDASPLATTWRERLKASGTEILTSTTVFAAVGKNRLLVDAPEGGAEIRANKIVLATGARELLLPFPGWTLPGVFGAGGLESLTKSGWPITGKRVVLAGSGPLLLAAAEGLKRHGAKSVTIVEQAQWLRILRFGLSLVGRPGKLIEGVRMKLGLLAVPYHCGCWPVRAEGSRCVEAVTLTDGRRQWTEPCDYLACGFGLVPNVEIAQFFGCRLRDGFVEVDRHQETSVPDVFCAGEPTGIGGMDCALVEGQIAGLCAAGSSDEARTLFRRRNSWHRFRQGLQKAFALREELKSLATPDTILCRCEDVRSEQLEPYTDFREAKLQTRCGMGPCQGRVCGTALAFLRGWENESVRPPAFPVPLAAMAGQPLAKPGPSHGPLDSEDIAMEETQHAEIDLSKSRIPREKICHEARIRDQGY